MITELIQKLNDKQDLSGPEARAAMEELMTGHATDAEIREFLTSLRVKGETAGELIAFARVMRELAEPFWDSEILPVLDTCGTGGDGSGTFNISTAAAFVAAGAGIRVAKHGNRSATSRCGSADVLEALGTNIEMPIDRLREGIREIGIGFLFARRFHKSMKHVAAARAQLKTRTVFNILGPLANPARARYQVVGVPSPDLMELMANALHGLDVTHAFVVHGSNGMDEISISGKTFITEMNGGRLKTYVISPEDFGIAPASVAAIAGGDAAENAGIVEAVLRGEKGPRLDVVILNAAAGIVAGGMAASLDDGVRIARESIESGAAYRRLELLREYSRH
jgi:anthranilate phosphoribosyltransferase